MAKTIKQTINFDANTDTIYSLLMNSKMHSSFTGAPAKISTKVGGLVSCYGGYISAINIELIPGKKIVQAWRGNDWKSGDWSMTTYTLNKKRKKTELIFEQFGIPDEQVAHIKKGWKEHYWDKMKDYLTKTK